MKEQDDKLTLQETEQLCSMYMDCSLSVLEETELRYFLTQVNYHSPMIDEVRRIMDIDTYVSDKASNKDGRAKKRLFRNWRVYAGVAASIALIIGIGISLRQPSSQASEESQSYYIAYANGQRLSDEDARIQVEAAIKSADGFLKEMTELEASKRQIIDDFFNP